MACKIDETVKLIDELIESKEWIKYNKKSGFAEDNKKLLKEAIAKLKSFKSLKIQSQSDKTPGSKDTNNKQGFNGYVSIKDTGGKGSIEGDAKDKAMREVADGFVGEIEDGRINNSSTGTSYKELKDNYSGNVKGGSTTYYGAANPTIVMLARNGSLKGKQLDEDTKDVIREYFDSGATFVVGDMPDVDSQFIDYLDEIGASYKIYHTGNIPRIKKQESETNSNKTPGSENEVQEQNNDNKIIKEAFDEALKKAHESKEMITLQNSFIGRNSKFNEPSRKYGDLIDKLVNGTVSGVNKYNILIDSNGNEIELYDPLNEEYKKEKQKIIEKYTEGLTYNNYGDEFDFYNPISYKQFSKDDIEAAKDIMAKNKKECE